MFKNATLIGYNPKASLAGDLTEHLFTEPGVFALQSSGWSPVRDDANLYVNDRQVLMNFSIEKKLVPAGAVKLVAAGKIKEMEDSQGFPVGKKQRKLLVEETRDALLGRALSVRSVTAVWIDTLRGRIVIDSVSNPVIDAIKSALVKTFGDIGMQDVAWPREKVITGWLLEEPAAFSLDDQVALQYPGDKGKVVKFTNADLDSDDILSHIDEGATVTAVAMTYNDRISFVMTDNHQVRRIRALDVIKTSAAEAAEVDKFDSDFALMTGELSALFDAIAGEA